MQLRNIVAFPLLTAPLLLAGAPAPLAAQVAAPSPANVAAGAYTVDAHHTQVLFSLTHFGFTDYHGMLSDVSGTLVIDPRRLAASTIDVTVPVASLATTSKALDAELQGADWFDAARYPTARFVSTRVTPTGARTARIDGDLTLHGVTKPVTLDATLGGAGVNPMSKAVTVGFSATGTIDRTAFGIAKYAPLVGSDVTLTISAAFEKAA